MKVSIIGAGYVGLVTGVCMAEKGHDVICVDVDEEKIAKINSGVPSIHEAGLEELLQRNIQSRLKATRDFAAAIKHADVSLIAVGTPSDGNEISLAQVREAAYQIGKNLRQAAPYHLVVVKSTVVPGTTDEIVLPILEESSGRKAGLEFGVAVNPEFLTEGQAAADFMNPDRIVLGANDDPSMQHLDRLYAGFQGTPMVRTNRKTAEMIKYASNALLATQISFANEFANLCAGLGGIDVVDVVRGVHLSAYLRPMAMDGSRIQAPISSFLEAGCGFGGSCLPKDVNALIAHAEARGTPMPLLRAVLDINKDRPRQVLALLKRHFSPLRNVGVSLLGLSFKPDTDDMRESPAIPIIRELLAQGAILRAYDPVANPEARKLFPDSQLSLCGTLEEALVGVDAVVLVTRWETFGRVPELLAKLNPAALFVDGRRMLDKHAFARYEGIGL